MKYIIINEILACKISLFDFDRVFETFLGPMIEVNHKDQKSIEGNKGF